MSSIHTCHSPAPLVRSGTQLPRKCTRTSATRTMCMSSQRDSALSTAATVLPTAPGRRDVLLLALAATALTAGDAQAVGFKKELKKRKIPIEEYSEMPGGLKYYDLVPGKGDAVAVGSTVTVHFDCLFRGIDVVSSRSARLLGGNRSIAEPFQFVAGEPIKATSAKMVSDSAGGLFSGMGGPRAPPALSFAVVGMKVGGKRSVMVPPELGYGDVGEQEIGPGQSFELQIEVLALA